MGESSLSPDQVQRLVTAKLRTLAAGRPDLSSLDLLDALVHRMMNVHAHAMVAQQANALIERMTPEQIAARGFVRHTAAATNQVLLRACIDAAAVALHLASQLEIDEVAS